MDRYFRLDESEHIPHTPSGVSASGIEASYPLTPMQAGMLFHHLYVPTLDAYFGQAHWPIIGPLEISTFHTAWQEVVQRHTILRTSFDWSGPSGPVQRVHRDATVPLESLDWRTLSPHEKSRHLATFLANDRDRGFDLAVPPLLRITVIRLDDDEHRVVWSGHHLLVDGRSINLVVREVMALYTGQCEGVPISWSGSMDRIYGPPRNIGGTRSKVLPPLLPCVPSPPLNESTTHQWARRRAWKSGFHRRSETH
jgi:hypothetical protein